MSIRYLILICSVPLLASLNACESSSKDNSSVSNVGTSSSTSSQAATTSHNPGSDCTSSSCHGTGGPATTFTVAGTVYRSGGGDSGASGVEVTLYRPNSNEILLQLTTDSLGNFYSGAAVQGLNDGSGGPYDGVEPDVNGNTMPGLITDGSCNKCHGTSNGVIRG